MMNTTKSPIFTIHEPHSDYGFESQFDYFQVLEEARKHVSSRSGIIDNLHFKLQKPISKDDNSKKIKKSRKRWWWKNALHFFKRKCGTSSSSSSDIINNNNSNNNNRNCVFSGAMYLTESRNGSGTPYHRTSTSRPSSGPLAGTIKDIPYISLREMNMDQSHKLSASPMPTSFIPVRWTGSIM